MFDKINSDIIADVKATPEQKEKKIIRKMKINKKVPLGKEKRQSAQLSSLLILPKPSLNCLSPAKTSSFASAQCYYKTKNLKKD